MNEAFHMHDLYAFNLFPGAQVRKQVMDRSLSDLTHQLESKKVYDLQRESSFTQVKEFLQRRTKHVDDDCLVRVADITFPSTPVECRNALSIF